MANELKIRNGLQINETQIISGITNNSTLLSDSSNIPTSSAVKGYIDSADSSLSTSISSEISTRISADSSLTTSISSRVVAETSLQTAISTTMSTEVSTRSSADSSLTTSISSRVVADTSLNTAISSEISTRIGADSSLTTAISSRVVADTSLQTAVSTTMSTEVSTRSSADSSLTTQISSEISTRIGADISLNTSIDGKLSLTGGTMTGTIIGTQLNLSGTIYVSGLTNDSSQPDVVYYNSTSKVLSYGTKPSGGGTTKLASFYNDVTTSGTSLTTLYSYTLSANTLSNNGDFIEGEYFLSWTESSWTGNIYLTYFNQDNDINSAPAFPNNWVVKIKVIRISSSSIRTIYIREVDDFYTCPTDITGLDLVGTSYDLLLKAISPSYSITAKMGTISLIK